MIQKLPSLDVEDFECITDFMLEFYRRLGWDPTKQELDPRKIAIHPDTWKEICMQVKRRWGIGSALIWMNQGPSWHEDNPHQLDPASVWIGTGAIANIQVEGRSIR